MTRNEIIQAVASREGVPQEDVNRVVGSFFEIIQIALSAGEEVKLINFGKFAVRERNAVTRRNPKTGDVVEVPAKTTVAFRPAPRLKELLNQ